MKRLLTSKAGVTVLEGIIALGLLALVTGGAFAVLLSASRQTSQPDVQEEMVWAVEKVNKLLRAYPMIDSLRDDPSAIEVRNMYPSVVPDGLEKGLCGGDSSPMDDRSEHNVECMLPPLCDKNNSSFTYKVEPTEHTITYDITCNGYKL